MKSIKRLLAFIMTLAMVLTMVPMIALAGGENYLTFTAEEANSKITLNYESGSNVYFRSKASNANEYTDWMSYSKFLITMAKGDKVQFKGTDVVTSETNHFTITQGKISASGSVTSLTDGTGVSTTTIKNWAYNCMFLDCTALISAPELPATTVNNHGYYRMFKGCTSLVTIPELPATTLGNGCYCEMFQGCTSLKIFGSSADGETAWNIPSEASTELNWNSNMFSGTSGDFSGNPVKGTTYYVGEKDYEITVLGIPVTYSNKGDVLGTADVGETVKYDSSTNTLTLDNATITAGSGIEYIIRNTNTGRDFTIKVIGNCTLSGEDCGIVVGTDKLIINGGGTLNVKLSSPSSAPAINSNSDIEISNITLNIDTSESTNSVGITTVGHGDIVIDNCQGSIVTKNAAIEDVNNVEISNSNFTCIKSMEDTAIHAYYDLKISDSTLESVIAKGYGLVAADNLSFTGKVVIDVLTEDLAIDAGKLVDFSALTPTSKIHAKATGTVNPYAIVCEMGTVELGEKCVVTTPEKGGVITHATFRIPGIGKDGEFASEATVECPYIVTFDSNDGSSVDAQKIIVGNIATKPTDPTKDGYAFDGWYTDEACTKAYDFATKITADITLYAKWSKVEYAIKETGSDATWTKGGSAGQKITSTADFSKFVSVSVDGKVVDATNYDKAEGSTIITFKPAYLETLAVGDHTIEIVSNDGSAKGTFTIVEAAKKEEPTTKKEETKVVEEEKVADTADNSAIGAFVALGAFAAVGYVSLKKRED